MLIPGSLVSKEEARREFDEAVPEIDVRLIWPKYTQANPQIFIGTILAKLQINLEEAYVLPPGIKIVCIDPGCDCSRKFMKVKADSIILAIERAKRQIANKREKAAQEIKAQVAIAEQAEKERWKLAEDCKASIVFNGDVAKGVVLTRHARERFCERFLGMSRQEAINNSTSLEVFQKISESFARARRIKISSGDMFFKFLRYGLAEYFFDSQDNVLFTLSTHKRPAVITITRYGRSPSNAPERYVSYHDPMRDWHKRYLNKQKRDKYDSRA